MADENAKEAAAGGLPEPAPANQPMDRRKFVKTALTVAAGGAVVAGAVPMVVPLSYNPRKIPRFPYVGARILPPGPAPQGIPLIPLTVNDEGVVEGIPENKKSKPAHNLAWYKYCSHEAAPGLEVGFTNDNTLEYYVNPEKIAAAKGLGIDLWYAGLLGQKVRADHFKNINDGAPFRWRSAAQEGTNVVTGIILRVPTDQLTSRKETHLAGFPHDLGNGSSLIAFCSFCAHFCCVPGYAENTSDKAKATRADKIQSPGRYLIYCTCHDSRYDPYDIREYTFPPDF